MTGKKNGAESIRVAGQRPADWTRGSRATAAARGASCFYQQGYFAFSSGSTGMTSLPYLVHFFSLKKKSSELFVMRQMRTIPPHSSLAWGCKQRVKTCCFLEIHRVLKFCQSAELKNGQYGPYFTRFFLRANKQKKNVRRRQLFPFLFHSPSISHS